MVDQTRRLRVLRMWTLVVCFIGILISCYAYHIEVKKEHDENYEAMCDISEHMSCTKAFMSKYGKGFGLVEYIVGEDSDLNQPNSVFGLAYYIVIAALGEWSDVRAAKIQVALGILGNIGSVYLAYILYFILYDFCVVCVTMYILNAILLILFLMRLFAMRTVTSKRKAKTQ